MIKLRLMLKVGRVGIVCTSRHQVVVVFGRVQNCALIEDTHHEVAIDWHAAPADIAVHTLSARQELAFHYEIRSNVIQYIFPQ